MHVLVSRVVCHKLSLGSDNSWQPHLVPRFSNPYGCAAKPVGPISLSNQAVRFVKCIHLGSNCSAGTSHVYSAPLIVRPWNQPSRRWLHSDIIGAAFLVRMQATGSCSRHLSSVDSVLRPVSIHVIVGPGSSLLHQFVWIGPQACDKRGVSFSRWRTLVAGPGLVFPAPAHRPAQPWGLVASPAGAARLPIHPGPQVTQPQPPPLFSLSAPSSKAFPSGCTVNRPPPPPLWRSDYSGRSPSRRCRCHASPRHPRTTRQLT